MEKEAVQLNTKSIHVSSKLWKTTGTDLSLSVGETASPTLDYTSIVNVCGNSEFELKPAGRMNLHRILMPMTVTLQS